MFGATKKAEYRCSAEMFISISKDKGAYFALAFLLDSQYNNVDLKEILKFIDPKTGKLCH